MTDSLPRPQQRPPDGEEGDFAGWDADAPPPPHDSPAAEHAGEEHDEQPGFPDRPPGPAEGGD